MLNDRLASGLAFAFNGGRLNANFAYRMSYTPPSLGEFSPRGDSAIRWFEPTIVFEPVILAEDDDEQLPIARLDSRRRDAVRWKEVDWVGFVNPAFAAPDPVPVAAELPNPGADSAADTASADDDESDRPVQLSAPPSELRYVGFSARPLRPIRHLRDVLRGRAGHLVPAGAAVMVLVASVYYGGERWSGLAGASPSVAVVTRPTPAQEAPIPHPPAAPVAVVGPRATVPEAPISPRAVHYLGLARSGEPAAAYDLAVLYVRGDGVAQNLSAAASWFRKAAQAGISAAAFNLGVMYERGLGVNHDMDEAINWYRRAAAHNYPPAQYNLAIAYAEGRGTPQDMIAAARWYHDAALQGLAAAMVNVAILYERGEGVAPSLPDAYAWYRAAARRGNTVAAHRARELFDQLNVSDKGSALLKASAVADALHEAPGEPPASSANMDGFDPRPGMAPGGWLGGSDAVHQPAG